MKLSPLITVVLILSIVFPRSIQAKRKSKPNKSCIGKDGNLYKVGEGYDNNKGIVCVHYKCVKKKKKFIMKKGKCGKDLHQAAVDTCVDAGCKNAFNGLGMCVDTASTDWANVSKTIDFTAGTKEGKCSKDCNCNCFKHTGCYSSKCDQLNGICLIPDQEEKRGFFIPDEYEKAFPCDKSLNCHCFIKNYDGVIRPSAAATETTTDPTCPPPPSCPTILPTSTILSTECPSCPLPLEPSTLSPSTPEASSCPLPPACPSIVSPSTTGASSCPPPLACPTTPSPPTECPFCPSPSEASSCPLPPACPTTPSPSTECPFCPSTHEASSCPPPLACPTTPSPPTECPICPSPSACPTTPIATCPRGWTSLATGCYKFVDEGNFQKVTTNCENEGGFLIEVDNQKELDAALQFYKDEGISESTVWFGATDLAKEGEWIWNHSGKKLTFTNWYSGEPNGGTRESCLHAYGHHNFQWNDVSCGNTYRGLCEYGGTQTSFAPLITTTAKPMTTVTTTIEAKNNCFERDINYFKNPNINNPSNNIHIQPKTDSAEECQNRCQTTNGCTGFTWVASSHSNQAFRNTCWPKSGPWKAGAYAGHVISGPRICQGATKLPTSPTCPTCPPPPTCPTILEDSTPPSTPAITECPSCPSTSPLIEFPSTPSTFLTTECPACPACPSTQSSTECPACRSPPPVPSYTSTPSTSTVKSPSESTTGANIPAIQGCSSDGQTLIVSNIEANIITSPGHPQTNYSANTFCDWTFQAPPGQKISFTLLELETEFGYDVIKLYDGAGGEEEKAPFLTTISGTNIYDAVISSKEELRVTFTTDQNNNMKGFKASVSAFNKEDMPRFDWLDEKNINVTFPNGKSEIIKLKISPNAHHSCIFHGKTVNTSLTISSSNTNSGCRSLTEDVEISITSNYLKGKFGLFSIKNGKLTKTDETVFVSNSLNREVSQLSKRSTGITLPKKIQIPVNFGFDRGLLTKLGKYGLGQNFIERRIEEVFDHAKYLLRGISSDISIDLIFKSAIVFIDDILQMNQQDLDKCRQFQVDEQTPLIVLIDDDYANHVKGLSFRSGLCRNNTERYGVTMIAWNDHSAFMGDVVYHEMGHMLGGIHDGGKSEHHSGLHLGHSEFNTQNVNEWFISAGYRCYGKTCTKPPSSPSQGSWTCDSSLTSCQLICSPGYTPVISHTDCINGQWDTTNSHICAPSSSNKLYVLAGGGGTSRNVELYHPTLGSPSCKSPPPQLTQDWRSHTTFIHNSTIYLCGGHFTVSICHSLTTGASAWTSHHLPSPVGYDLSSLVMNQRILFIGGYSDIYYSATYATLPLSSSPTLTQVPNLSYQGQYPCVAKVSPTTFVITGGSNRGTLSTVILYNNEKQSETPLTSLSPPRYLHGCISIQEEGKMFLIVTGGYGEGALATTQRLDITANTWEDLGDLKQKRRGHTMINSQDRGIMVLGGRDSSGYLKSVELLVGKEWQKIEPSLQTPKSSFGAVEVPADFFNCQLNLKPGLGCPATNINTLDREDETVLENISTMEECSLECKKNLKCSYWTWFNGGQCALMSSYESTLSDSTAVTADKLCDLGCPTPPVRDNGNWTCNEVNTICTLSCSPGYVSLHTEIKCRGGTWEDAESINCWQKKQPVEITGCEGEYHYDFEHPGGEVVSVPEGESCHSVCEGRQDCVTWTWTNDQVELQECRLQTSLGTTRSKTGSIAGIKNACKPLCYWIIGGKDEATTNSRYCEDIEKEHGCKEIIQMEPSQFKDSDEILLCHETPDSLQCENIPYGSSEKLCNSSPAVLANSIHRNVRKRRFTRSNYVSLSWGR